jgi:cellulose synthase/poly-beta-1,6-N-acetylglucosamine synthase-like glycosyltransferase
VNTWCLGGAFFMFSMGLLASYLLIYSEQKDAEFLLTVMMGYSGISLFRMVLYVIGAIKFNHEYKNIPSLERVLRTQEVAEYPLISVLVPAYNEEKVIAEVIKNYDQIEYPHFEIILVDDGSKDDTYGAAKAAVRDSEVNIRVYSKPNGGKASALNFALEKSRGEFVLCMDADSKLAPETLRSGVRHFYLNPNLSAVAGIVKVENTNSFLGRMQYLDYLYGHVQKKILSLCKTVTIVPGPIGLFRKSDLLAMDGYEKENTTYAEDTELTLKLLSAGKDVICDEGMISYTEAPSSYNDLYRQRYRWTRGIFQAVIKNAHRFLTAEEPKNQLVLMYLFWEQVIFPLIDFTLLFSFVFCYFFTSVSTTASMLLLYIYAMDIAITLMATKGEGKRLYWIYQSFLARFFYTNILVVWKISAFYDEWVARGMSWDKLSRKGFIKS